MPRHEPRLRLDPRFTHLVEADGSFVLVSDEDSAVLEGQAVAELLPLLDGQRTAIQIAQAIEDRHRPEMVHFALLQLEAAGLTHAVAPRVQSTRDASTPMAVAPEAKAKGDLAPIASALRRAWSERGRQAAVLSQIPGSALRVVLTDDYLSPDVRALIERARGPEALLMARVGPADVWVGPITGGNCGACISCLQERLRINLTARAFQHAAVGATDLRVQALAHSTPEGVFTLLAEQFYNPEPNPLWGPASFCVLALDGKRKGSHPVQRLPACATCGDLHHVPPGATVTINSRPHQENSGGGYRIWTPETTWERFSP